MRADLVAAVVVALVGGGFLASVVQGFMQRRKMGADYADVIARSATGLLKPLTERVAELERSLIAERATVDQLRRELEAARREVGALRAELAIVRNEQRETQ